MKLQTTGIVLAGLLLSSMITPVLAEDDGKALYASKLCMTCHGDEGKKPIIPSYPKLNGQNKEYLVAQIQMIKDGTRGGGGTAAMKAMVTSLTDAEIEAISDYLSKVE
ncbi:MAG: c-type cytochrome [Leucothrix sp.]